MNCGAVAINRITGLSLEEAVASIMHYRRGLDPGPGWDLPEGWREDDGCCLEPELESVLHDLGWVVHFHYLDGAEWVKLGEFKEPGLWLISTYDHVMACRDGIIEEHDWSCPLTEHPNSEEWIWSIGKTTKL